MTASTIKSIEAKQAEYDVRLSTLEKHMLKLTDTVEAGFSKIAEQPKAIPFKEILYTAVATLSIVGAVFTFSNYQLQTYMDLRDAQLKLQLLTGKVKP